MKGQGGEKKATLEQQETPPTIYDRFERGVSQALLSRWEKAKNLNWWTFSKVWVVISVTLISMAATLWGLSHLVSMLSKLDTPTLVSVSSALLGLSPWVLPIFLTAVLGVSIGVVSIVTSDSPILIIEKKGLRYLVHSAKLIIAGFLLVTYYKLFSRTPISLSSSLEW